MASLSDAWQWGTFGLSGTSRGRNGYGNRDIDCGQKKNYRHKGYGRSDVFLPPFGVRGVMGWFYLWGVPWRT